MAGKRIAVLGVGAIGGTIGGCLTMAGYDVTLIDQWPENVETMKAKGLRISGTHGEHQIPVNAIHLTDASPSNAEYGHRLCVHKIVRHQMGRNFHCAVRQAGRRGGVGAKQHQ